MPARLKSCLIFLAAVVIAQLCASIAASQFVLAELSTMGVPIALGTRVEVTLTDIWRSAPLFWLLIIPSLLLSILIAAAFKRRVSNASHTVILMLCSGGLLWLLNILLNNLFGISLIAGFRGWGVLGLIVSGGFGGWCYRVLVRGRKNL